MEMKISELIAKLTELREQHGDVECRMGSPEDVPGRVRDVRYCPGWPNDYGDELTQPFVDLNP